MSFFRRNSKAQHVTAQAAALQRSFAVIEFDMEGTILDANDKFLKTLGYSLDEIIGKHHRIFVESEMRDSDLYVEFWNALQKGKFQAGEFKRIGKDGQSVWIQGSYNPVFDAAGVPYRIIKFAIETTQAKIRSLEDAGRIKAIDRVQAVVEFRLDGTILDANEEFLNVVGYSLEEIQGKHHEIFVEPSLRNTSAYQEFWAALNDGHYQTGEFKRLRKDGKQVWILASYNPIIDERGKPFKIVKFATDVTADRVKNADFSGQIAAISKSQAVIEFDLSGKILSANNNFLGVLGYSLSEVEGKHHSMFVTATEQNSAAYREFWASLNRGEYQAGEFLRLGKSGHEVWIQASYNPILDLDGKPFKVVKYATDTTRQVIARKQNEHVRKMLESVASGAEELNASVRQISSAMVKSEEVARDAVERVETADNQAQRLSAAANAMRGIVELIANITGQINLLALNATIESARAGEAGRGFAVVAAEVKNLANQAKLATDKIEKEICNLTGISDDVVHALADIKQAIQSVSEYVISTAAAVDEQSTVTNDMSFSMQRAATEAASIK